MSLLVYGIVEAGDVEPTGSGLDDHPLWGLAEGPLVAIVSDHDERPDSRPPSGASYLRDRFELRQSARRVASVLEPLTSLARGSRRSLVPQPDLPVLDAYLVDRVRVREFLAMVQQLGDGLEDVELVCTGPWPPYSFAEGTPV